MGANLNVAAALVIGIEPGWTERVVQGIVKTGKPVMGFSIVRHGDLRTIAEVSRNDDRVIFERDRGDFQVHLAHLQLQRYKTVVPMNSRLSVRKDLKS